MPSTAEAARDLLISLSDDELARYGEIARDQAAAELSRWWLQAMLVVGAVGAMGWGIVKLVSGETQSSTLAGGGTQGIVLSLVAGLALAYSPYRRLLNWTLWRRHCSAVASEQERRVARRLQG